MARLDILRCMRRFCLECQGESAQQVRLCTDKNCALWPWRMGDKADAIEQGEPLLEQDVARDAENTVAEKLSDAQKAQDRARKLREALRTIRKHCLNCAGDRREVRQCAAKEQCTLWSLRFGVRPETYKDVRRRFFSPKKLSLF